MTRQFALEILQIWIYSLLGGASSNAGIKQRDPACKVFILAI